MAQRRTTHRSSKGTKLYAVRKDDGTFADIQSYKRAHAADLRRSAKDEDASAKKMPAKQAVRKAGAAASGLLARARKAVAGVVRQVRAAGTTTKKTEAKTTAAK